MADKRSLALILALSAIAVLIFIVAVACNATSVATANWVSITVSSSETTESQLVLGLWGSCTRTSDKPTWNCTNYDPTLDATHFRYIYASRALSIVPLALTLTLVLAGCIARHGGIIFAFAIGTAILGAVFLSSALVVISFFMPKTIETEKEILVKCVEVLPGWSLYVGGVGAFFYFFCALWLFIMGVAITDIGIVKRLENDVASFGGGTDLKTKADAGEGYKYKQLKE